MVAKSPIERIRSFARERGWRHLQLLSSAHNSYNADYHGETEQGDQIPALNVFVRRDSGIHHFYNTELLYLPWTGGEEPRHVDTIWPVWSLLDVRPEGRGDRLEPETELRRDLGASAPRAVTRRRAPCGGWTASPFACAQPRG